MGLCEEIEKEIKDLANLAKKIVAAGSHRVEYKDAELYLIDTERARYLDDYMKAIAELLQREGAPNLSKGKNSGGFAGEMNFINPNAPAVRYRLYTRKTPRIISDKDKVLSRMEKEFAIWVNQKRKWAREKAEVIEDEGGDPRAFLDEVEAEIEIHHDRFERILESPDDYDIRITNYETAKAYPAINYTKKGGGSASVHLSIHRPNILWYEEEEAVHNRRSDATIKKIIEEYERVGGTIYIHKKGL
jgi:hypothetical protein